MDMLHDDYVEIVDMLHGGFFMYLYFCIALDRKIPSRGLTGDFGLISLDPSY